MRWSCIMTALLLIGGCAAPEISVQYVLPGPTPLPAGADGWAVGEFLVTTREPLQDVQPLKDELARRLPRPGNDRQALTVSGRVRIEVTEDRSARTMEARGNEVELPSLVRKASVRVYFDIAQTDGKRWAGVDVERSYDSAADPATRGPLGLERPDDPSRAPPPQIILDHLERQCAQQFCKMVAQIHLLATVPMRPSLNVGNLAAQDDVRAGKLDAALLRLQKAHEEHPQNEAVLFNLALTAEGTRNLELAEKSYERLLRRSPRDTEARQGLQRVRRVLASSN